MDRRWWAAAGALAVLSTQAPSVAGPERLPVVLPQCVAGQFAPGVVTPSPGEGIGPTDVNAQTANRGLAVGLNREGSVTVFRWPRPSYYDQIKEFTLDRSQRYVGAYPNEGAFLGVVLGGRTTWLRDWHQTQRFASPESDEVVNSYERAGVRVTTSTVSPMGHDVLARRVVVRADPGAKRPTALVAFENFNLVFGKFPGLPGQDWCTEEQNGQDLASYDSENGAIVHSASGVDESTGQLSSVAVALGFADGTQQHQVGGDAFDPTAAPGGQAGPLEDAYLDAADGSLQGNDEYLGQTTGAVLVPLEYRGAAAANELDVAAGPDPASAVKELQWARGQGEPEMAAAKARWLQGQLARAPLPATNDDRIRDMAKRDLVLLLTTADKAGPIVASITTQPPYAEDWPRDGAFLDHALDQAGYLDMAKRHNLFYVATQATETYQPPGSSGIPPGNWAMNYYADGVVGGPIPWEIDETGFAVWSLWDYYAVTHDLEYLRQVYPTIRRAADFLVQCKESDGLQCHGTEDDDFALYQDKTILGAATTWMGLDMAARAARALGNSDDAARYTARRDELGRAIDTELWTGHDYGGTWGGGSYLIWPARFRSYDDPRIRSQAEYIWRSMEPTFDAPGGPRTSGAYEGKGLMALALVYRHTDPAKLSRVRRGLRWIAHVEATPDTGVVGETWRTVDGQVQTQTAMPHLWEHTLFYLATLEAFGRR